MGLRWEVVRDWQPSAALIQHWRHRAGQATDREGETDEEGEKERSKRMSCEQVLDAMARARPEDFKSRAVPVASFMEEARRFVEERGLQCMTLSAGNLERKLESLHGCTVVQRQAGRVVVFPGFVGEVERRKKAVAAAAVREQEKKSALEAFVKERLEKADGAWVALARVREVLEETQSAYNRMGKLKDDLQELLGVACKGQKWIGGRNETNVFVGWRLKGAPTPPRAALTVQHHQDVDAEDGPAADAGGPLPGAEEAWE
jgi:hypothetical protein